MLLLIHRLIMQKKQDEQFFYSPEQKSRVNIEFSRAEFGTFSNSQI